MRDRRQMQLERATFHVARSAMPVRALDCHEPRPAEAVAEERELLAVIELVRASAAVIPRGAFCPRRASRDN